MSRYALECNLGDLSLANLLMQVGVLEGGLIQGDGGHCVVHGAGVVGLHVTHRVGLLRV